MEVSERGHAKQRRRPRRSLARTVLSFSAVALVLSVGSGGIAGYLTMRRAGIGQAKEYLGSFIGERVDRENDRMQRAHERQASFQRALGEALAAMDPSKAKAEFSRRVTRRPDGSWRNNTEYFDGSTMAGVYLAPDLPVDGKVMALVAAAAALCEYYGRADAAFDQNVYVFRPDGIMVIYWPEHPDWCQKLEPGYRISEQEYSIAGMKAAEDGRSFAWTGIYRDATSGQSMVSCLSPLTAPGGGLLAIAGFDLSMGELLRRISTERLAGSTDIVFETGGRLIAHSKLTEEILASGGTMTVADAGDARLTAIAQEVNAGPDGISVTLEPAASALIGLGEIRGPGWFYAIQVPLASVSGPALRSSAVFLALCSVSIALACAFLFLILRTRIDLPLRRLMSAVDAISGGDLGVPIPADTGDELGRLAFSINAMRRKLLEESGKFLSFFDLTPAPICLTRFSDGAILAANEIFAEFFGFRKEELSSKTILDLGLYGDIEERRKLTTLIKENGLIRDFIAKGKPTGGQMREFMLSSRFMRLDGEECLLTALEDLGPVRKAEAALRESEARYNRARKMECVGRLAGGLAHDFNDLLTAIIGNVELAAATPGLEGKPRLHLEATLRASEGATALARQLLAFSPKKTSTPVALNLDKAIVAMRASIKRLVGEAIELRTAFPAGLWDAAVDPGQLGQILMNLAANARDAMPSGGILSIEAENASLDEEAARSHPGSQAGDYVRLSVSDTGSGMSEEVMAHLFEPFYTTKGDGRGTGLGLTAVYGSVVQNGGFIEADSAPSRGTSFTIHLRRANAQAEGGHGSEGLAEGEDLSAPGGETVFIAEDEEILRALILETLAQNGYRAYAFADGPSLLEAARGKLVDVLLADIVMPGMNGKELAAALTAEHPETIVLYSSGYSPDDVIDGRSAPDEGIEFIGKPYKPDVLLRKLRILLTARARGTAGDGA